MTIVFFDTETCGLTDDCPTIQIAAIAVDDAWNELATFERKLKFPPDERWADALAMNSYDGEVWARDAVKEQMALLDFCAFLKPYREIERISRAGKPYMVARVAGHSAATFDHPRLTAACKRYNLFLPTDWPVLDTMLLAGWHFHGKPKPQSYKLTDLCKHFGIPVESAHDALADARMSMRLAQAMTAAVPASV